MIDIDLDKLRHDANYSNVDTSLELNKKDLGTYLKIFSAVFKILQSIIKYYNWMQA